MGADGSLEDVGGTAKYKYTVPTTHEHPSFSLFPRKKLLSRAI